MQELLSSFIFFFAVIDPIGTIPVFIAVTQHYDDHDKTRIALKATYVAAFILIGFVVAGEFLLATIDIPLSAFQIAGGIVLFLFALSMIFGESKPEEELKLIKSSTETAIFPLAIPSIAGPGAILAAILMTEKPRFNFWEQLQTTGVLLSVLLINLGFMLAAGWISQWIGKSGASVISRIMGLILSSIAVSSVLAGIKLYFSL